MFRVSGPVIAGFPEPMPDRQGGVGQLINDASTSIDEKERKKHNEDNRKKQKLPLYNVTDVYEDNCFKMVATRKIKKGDQLYYNYGDTYWMSAHCRDPNVTVREYFENKLRVMFRGNNEAVSTVMELYSEGPTDPGDPLRHYRNRYELVEAVREIMRQDAEH